MNINKRPLRSEMLRMKVCLYDSYGKLIREKSFIIPRKNKDIEFERFEASGYSVYFDHINIE